MKYATAEDNPRRNFYVSEVAELWREEPNVVESLLYVTGESAVLEAATTDYDRGNGEDVIWDVFTEQYDALTKNN